MLFGVGLGVGAAVKGEAKVEKVEAVTTTFNDAAVYLDTSSCWENGDERFAVYWSDGSNTGWYSMIGLGTNFYGARLPAKDITLVIFCRMDGATTDNNWSNKWNQTADLSSSNFSKSSAVFKVSKWDGADKSDWKANSGYTSNFADRYVACADNNWSANDSGYKLSLDMTKAEGRLVKEFSITTPETKEFLKVTDGSWKKSYGCSHVVDGTSSTYVDLSEGDNNNIGLKVAGTYEIYWKYLATDSKEIWIQIGSDTEANNYATTFLASITCTSSGVDFARSVWNKVGDAKTSMEYKFSQLTTGAKNLLIEAEGDEDGSKVEQCIARYDRILYKYGYGEGNDKYHDFMGRKPATMNGSTRIQSVLGDETATNATLATVIITVVSLAAVGGFFFLRKKKLSK